MKKKCPHCGALKRVSRDQIKCQNTRIKVIDSYFTNMCTFTIYYLFSILSIWFAQSSHYIVGPKGRHYIFT